MSPEKSTTILIYGDSNTWGYTPGVGGRMPADTRWPGALQKILGGEYRIIEEGLCGRTTARDDPFAPATERNGMKTLTAILDTHRPLDMVVIFLGTNDLKEHFSMPPDGIAKGVENLIAAARNPFYGAGGGESPAVLAICPAPIEEVAAPLIGDFFRGGREKSLALKASFGRMGARCGTPVLYAGDFVASDTADGIHLSPDSHAKLAREVAQYILAHFG